MINLQKITGNYREKKAKSKVSRKEKQTGPYDFFFSFGKDVITPFQ